MDQGVCRSIVRCMLTGEVITCIVENYVGRDVHVRYVFSNDTNGGQDVPVVLSILAVSLCFWLEVSPGIYCTDVSYDCMEFMQHLGSACNKLTSE